MGILLVLISSSYELQELEILIFTEFSKKCKNKSPEFDREAENFFPPSRSNSGGLFFYIFYKISVKLNISSSYSSYEDDIKTSKIPKAPLKNFKIIFKIIVKSMKFNISSSYSSYEDDIKTNRIAIPVSTIWQGQTIKTSRLRQVCEQITFNTKTIS